MERRKKQWLELSKNSAKPPHVPCVPQNGQNPMVSYTFVEKSTFQIPQNSDVGLFPSVMTRRLPDIAEGGKRWSSYLGITGGRKCPATSENMFPFVTCVSARRHPADHI